MKIKNQNIATPPDEEQVNWPVVIGIIVVMAVIVLLLNFA